MATRINKDGAQTTAQGSILKRLLGLAGSRTGQSQPIPQGPISLSSAGIPAGTGIQAPEPRHDGINDTVRKKLAEHGFTDRDVIGIRDAVNQISILPGKMLRSDPYSSKRADYAVPFIEQTLNSPQGRLMFETIAENSSIEEAMKAFGLEDTNIEVHDYRPSGGGFLFALDLSD